MAITGDTQSEVDAARAADNPPNHAGQDLKGKTVRGAAAMGVAQASQFALRVGSMVILARLLYPTDFGLFGMVTAITGFLATFRDFGLAMASVTREKVTKEQLSTLFWFNVAVGLALAMLCIAVGPILVAFYGQPELLPITLVLALGFIFNGASAQHRAILQRNMRFVALASIDFVGLCLGIAIAIALAASGFRYWALVAMTLVPQSFALIGSWIATGWVPGKPRRGMGVRSMLVYGGTVTLNGLIVYIAYNVDKVLLGRFWGADVLGIYGRAYQLVTIPTDLINATASQVAFPALARIQNDRERLRNYFMRGYGVIIAVLLPVNLAAALFANDVVEVFLGSRWHEAADLFRLLTPAMLVLAVINPFGWLMQATGFSVRSMKIALLIAPAVIAGYLLGLPSGAVGVAIGFSSAMVLLTIPIIVWVKRGTAITTRDVLGGIAPPVVAAILATVAALGGSRFTELVDSTFLRLCAECSIFFLVYLVALLAPSRQRTRYTKLLREMRRPTSAE